MMGMSAFWLQHHVALSRCCRIVACVHWRHHSCGLHDYDGCHSCGHAADQLSLQFSNHPTFISRLRSLACGEVICCGSCGGSATSLLRQAAAYRTTVAPRLQVWLLAKTVFSSMDSGYHQLISHFLQTHCCIEPYIIASRRELSTMNPVSFSELPAVPA